MTQFIQTLAQTIGPEATMKHVDPAEYIKRLAAAQGIDVLNLIKTQERLQQEMQQQRLTYFKVKSFKTPLAQWQMMNIMLLQPLIS